MFFSFNRIVFYITKEIFTYLISFNLPPDSTRFLYLLFGSIFLNAMGIHCKMISEESHKRMISLNDSKIFL